MGRELVSFEEFIRLVAKRHNLSLPDAELLLQQKLKLLRLRPVDIVTYLNFTQGNFSQRQLGQLLQVSQSTICYRLSKFRKLKLDDDGGNFLLPDLSEMDEFNEQADSNNIIHKF